MHLVSANAGPDFGLSSCDSLIHLCPSMFSLAARLASNGNSFNNLMLKNLSRDQLSHLAREGGLSSASLSNMLERKNSFDALMSLDFQSLQSIDNLANLINKGGAPPASVPSSGMQNGS